MGTRSTIAIQRDTGEVAQISCHWDGYIEHNGEILFNYYKDTDKIEQLIALGDLSSLDREIGAKHEFGGDTRGECTAYGRDRGETNTQARFYDSFEDYLERGQREEYNYIFRRGDWYVQCDYQFDGRRILLSDAIEIMIAESAE